MEELNFFVKSIIKIEKFVNKRLHVRIPLKKIGLDLSSWKRTALFGFIFTIVVSSIQVLMLIGNLDYAIKSYVFWIFPVYIFSTFFVYKSIRYNMIDKALKKFEELVQDHPLEEKRRQYFDQHMKFSSNALYYFFGAIALSVILLLVFLAFKLQPVYPWMLYNTYMCISGGIVIAGYVMMFFVYFSLINSINEDNIEILNPDKMGGTKMIGTSLVNMLTFLVLFISIAGVIMLSATFVDTDPFYSLTWPMVSLIISVVGSAFAFLITGILIEKLRRFLSKVREKRVKHAREQVKILAPKLIHVNVTEPIRLIKVLYYKEVIKEAFEMHTSPLNFKVYIKIFSVSLGLIIAVLENIFVSYGSSFVQKIIDFIFRNN